MTKRTIPASTRVDTFINVDGEISIVVAGYLGYEDAVYLTAPQARQVAVWLVELADELESEDSAATAFDGAIPGQGGGHG